MQMTSNGGPQLLDDRTLLLNGQRCSDPTRRMKMRGTAGKATLDELRGQRNEISVAEWQLFQEKEQLQSREKQLEVDKVDIDKAIALLEEVQQDHEVKEECEEESEGSYADEEGLEAEAAEGHAEEGAGSECEQWWEKIDSEEESEVFFAEKQWFRPPGPYTTESIAMSNCRVGVIHKNGNLCKYWQERRGCRNGDLCHRVHDRSIKHQQRKLYDNVDRKPQRKHKQGFAARTQHRMHRCAPPWQLKKKHVSLRRSTKK